MSKGVTKIMVCFNQRKNEKQVAGENEQGQPEKQLAYSKLQKFPHQLVQNTLIKDTKEAN